MLTIAYQPLHRRCGAVKGGYCGNELHCIRGPADAPRIRAFEGDDITRRLASATGKCAPASAREGAAAAYPDGAVADRCGIRADARGETAAGRPCGCCVEGFTHGRCRPGARFGARGLARACRASTAS